MLVSSFWELVQCGRLGPDPPYISCQTRGPAESGSSTPRNDSTVLDCLGEDGGKTAHSMLR